MLRLNENLHRNTGILIVVFVFLALSFVARAQTRTARKSDSASTVKKKPTPTPKKTVKTTATKVSTAKTSTDKKTAGKKTSKTAIAKSTVSKTTVKSTAKTAAKSTNKSVAKPTKTPSKSSSKAANSSAQTKTTKKPAETLVKVSSAKTSKTNSTKPVVQSAPREPTQAIVTVSSARIRSEPNTSSSEIRRMKLGTLVKVLEENPAWYKVETLSSSKQTGWISKQVAGDFDEDKREEIYRQITDRNFKTDKMAFTDAAELYEFLTRAQNEVKNPLSSEIGFKRLLALRSALKAVPFGKGEEKPYGDFLKSNNKIVVYSDPSGEWYVRSELLWDLRKKHSKETIAEEIAWAAAQNPLPGECEGYINCYLFVLRETDGEYLTLYPNGKYAEESLKNIQNLIEPIASDLTDKKVYTGPTDVSDRAEFNRLIAELRTIVSKLPFAEIEKQKTIQQLNKIAEGYR